MPSCFGGYSALTFYPLGWVGPIVLMFLLPVACRHSPQPPVALCLASLASHRLPQGFPVVVEDRSTMGPTA